MEERSARLARVHHGVVGRSQLVDLGHSERGIDRSLASGRLERVHSGAYRAPGAPRTWEQAVMAAVTACGGEAVASHRTAARLWGLVDASDDVIDVSVGPSRLPRPRGVAVHRSTDLEPRWCTVRASIPVTNPLRTLVDLGAVVPRWVVGDAFERALVARLVTVGAVEWARTAHARPGRSGSGVIGALLDQRALGSRPPDSVLEARGAALFARSDLPAPEFQHVVRAGGRFVARVDFAYPDLCLAIELDGVEHHATAAALQRDLERQNDLVSLGWTVLRFTWLDVVRRPRVVARSVTFVRDRLSTGLSAQSDGNRR